MIAEQKRDACGTIDTRTRIFLLAVRQACLMLTRAIEEYLDLKHKTAVKRDICE